MSDCQEAPDDELLTRARDMLFRAMMSGDDANICSAVEALIEVKIVIMLETMADRVQDTTGIRP